MRPIEQLLAEYGESHQNETNKLIHWICVPLIFLSIIGLIWAIPHEMVENILGDGRNPYANWATILLVVVMAYYITLSIPLAIGLGLFSLLCLFIVNMVEQHVDAQLSLIFLGVCVLAWVGQFYGHKVEGKKPSFLKDLQFLLIGPAWLMSFIYKKLGLPY